MSTFEWTSAVIAGLAAAINLGALVFVGMQVRHAASESRKAAVHQAEERYRQKKRDTINAVIATSQQRERLKTALPWNDRDATEVSQFLPTVEHDQEKRAAVRAYLDYLEMVAVGVNDGVLDVETISRIFGGRVLAVVNNYAPYIERRRTELKSPSLYAELYAMAAAIRAYQQDSVPHKLTRAIIEQYAPSTIG